MENKSTFWTLAAVIAVMITATVLIGSLETAPLRRPFTVAGDNGFSGEDFDQFATVEEQKAVFDDLSLVNLSNPEASTEIRLESFRTVDFEINKSQVNTDPIQRFSLSRLSKTSLRSPVIKKIPFEGLVFGELALDDLISYNPKVANIEEKVLGKYKLAYQVYAFEDLDSELSDEIYRLIRTALTARIDVTINETNSFGMASFFINFNIPKQNAFLVVKFQDAVYALTYLKAESPSGMDYYAILKQILSR